MFVDILWQTVGVGHSLCFKSAAQIKDTINAT